MNVRWKNILYILFFVIFSSPSFCMDREENDRIINHVTSKITIKLHHVKVLAKALKNTNTCKLILDNKGMGFAEIQHLAEALEHNTTITSLYLDNNPIELAGVEALATALKQNKTIKTLWITVDNIGPKGAKAIAEALEHNITLTYLNLSGNPLMDKGAQAIANALEHNTTLEFVDLVGTNITEVGAFKLSTATVFRNLNLENNIKIVWDNKYFYGSNIECQKHLVILKMIGDDSATIEKLKKNQEIDKESLVYQDSSTPILLMDFSG